MRYCESPGDLLAVEVDRNVVVVGIASVKDEDSAVSLYLAEESSCSGESNAAYHAVGGRGESGAGEDDSELLLLHHDELLLDVGSGLKSLVDELDEGLYASYR